MRKPRLEAILFGSIVLILAALAIPRYLNVLERTRERQVRANAFLLQERLETFARETSGWYPIDPGTRVREFRPDAKVDFNLEDVVGEAHRNPYLGESGIAFHFASPGETHPEPRPGVVVYVPGDTATVQGVAGAREYRVLGFGKGGERLDFELRKEPTPASR
jgi:type II secretory pathway pseudopilin PulG